MSKKWGIFIFFLTIGSLLVIVTGTTEFEDNSSNNFNDTNNIDRDLISSIDIIGNYVVKDDKGSNLYLNEEGDYELNINVCEGYVKITGKYELIDKKLKLINELDISKYETLNDNKELSFTIIDNDTIRLDEDLVCLFQDTLFER